MRVSRDKENLGYAQEERWKKGERGVLEMRWGRRWGEGYAREDDIGWERAMSKKRTWEGVPFFKLYSPKFQVS